jgi:protein SCO1
VNVAHHWAGGDPPPKPPATEKGDDEGEERVPRPRPPRPVTTEDVPDTPDPPGPLPIFDTTIRFSLVDQDGLPVSHDDLLGKIWVAGFVYTYCSGPCPMLSSAMAKLHRTFDRPDVRFVSVSCDPERDTSASLRDYAETYQADTSRWKFLTGDRRVIGSLAKVGFLQADDENDPLLHSNNLMLVDAKGRMRGYYDGRSPNMMKRLERHLGRLLQEEPPPTESRPR